MRGALSPIPTQLTLRELELLIELVERARAERGTEDLDLLPWRQPGGRRGHDILWNLRTLYSEAGSVL